MSAYKMIAFDMDGTLLDSKKELRMPVRDAIAAAGRSGKIVALSTGRSVSELGLYDEALQDVQYWVAESGALVYDSRNRKILDRTYFERRALETLTSVSSWEGIDAIVQGMSEGMSYMEERGIRNLAHYNMGVYQSLYDACGRSVPGRDFFLKNTDGFEKINIYFASREQREQAFARLSEENLPVIYARAEISNLECSPEGVSKASGLVKLCSHLGISVDEVMAVGDADNDLDMLGAVGFPIAMGNANDHVKAIAKAVVADNDHDGTAEAIYQYLLG